MAGDDDLRINTLHRFAKHSPKLVLHEYSHCEVPAGCGGVVMRWVDPTQGVPATFRIHNARGRVWLDGTELTSSLGLLPPGERTIALEITRDKAVGPQPFAFGVTYDNEDDADLVRVGRPRWRSTSTRPAEGWTAVAFDDAAWAPAPRAATELIAAQDTWTRRALEAHGDAVFVLAGDALWLRVTFTARPTVPEGE